MDENVKKGLNILAYASPSLYGDFAKYFYSAENSGLHLLMQFPNFDLLNAVQFLTANQVDVVIAEPHVDRFNITDFLSLRQKSSRPILLVGFAYAGADMEQFSRSGMDVCYPLPLNEGTVAKMNSELPEKLAAVSGAWKKGAWDSVSTQEIRDAVSQSAAGNWQKSVISVYSPKGGVGKTTVAVELASVLAGVGGRNVCLLDTNLNGGHVRLRLNVVSEHSIVSVASMYAGAKNNNSDWASAQREINQEMEKFLIPVPGSSDLNGRYNFYCIPGITTQEQARSPYLKAEACGEFMRSLIDYLKQRFDFVVIDVGSSINVPLHRESFKNSDVILVVCDADAACIADTQKIVTKTLAMQFPIEKFALVLNRWQENLGISMQDVATRMGIPVRGLIQNDHLGGIVKAGNAGCSYVVSNNRKPDNPLITERCMQGFVSLAATFYPPVAPVWAARAESVKGFDRSRVSSGDGLNRAISKTNKKKGLFARLFGRD